MAYFLETLTKMFKENPDNIAFKKGGSKRSITYKEAEDYSGRVYNYLKQKGIGKEDFVFICLPRGVRPFIAMIGIWKAGAAMTIVESTYPEERIEFIKKDVNAKLVITEDLYEEMMTYDYLEGYVEADEHDACFAIYTSGSTGNPKGVLHEYGKLDMLLKGSMTVHFGNSYAFANIVPLNFIATIGFCFVLLMEGYQIHIIPYAIAKNPPAFLKYIEDNHITLFFGTPTLLRVLPYIPSCVERVFSGGELLSNLYVPGVEVVNIYSSSESAFSVATFMIDKKYEVTPVGKPNLIKEKYKLLDENGNEVAKGEKGEVCVPSKFTRGYINLPEKTKEVFVDGLYHMRDIGYIDENDNLVICGRIDDMIKINGNRIEPAEIETNIKRALKINYCVAIGFSKPDRAYVAAYFIRKELGAYGLLDEKGNLKLTNEEINKKLEEYLPYYMIPTYYVVLDEFPKNYNGKIYKKGFPEPNAKIEEKPYVKPETKEEEFFCHVFEKTLNLSKVSVDDDFYLIGGDSIKSMLLVAEINNPEITIAEIYKERTPRRLAVLLASLKDLDTGTIDERNIKALEHLQPISGSIKWAVENQLTYPNTTFWNLCSLQKLQDNVDLNKFKDAINKVLKAHPAFSTHIVCDEEDKCFFKYDPSYFVETSIVEMSNKEFEYEKQTFNRPFKIFRSALYRSVIYSVDGSYYLWLCVHHSLTDGTSLQLINRQITQAYNDDTYEVEKDYLYLILRDYYKKSITEEGKKLETEYKNKLEDVYKELGSTSLLSIKKDFDCKSYSAATNYYKLEVSKKSISEKSLLKKYGSNNFFYTAYLKALSLYNQRNIGIGSMVYNGRNKAIKMNSNGLLFQSLVECVDFNKTNDFEEALSYVTNDISNQISKDYNNSYDAICVKSDFSDIAEFIYQNNIIKAFNDKLFKEVVDVEGTSIDILDVILSLQVVDNDNSDYYDVMIEYSKDMLKKESIDNLYHIFESVVKENI